MNFDDEESLLGGNVQPDVEAGALGRTNVKYVGRSTGSLTIHTASLPVSSRLLE